MLSAFITGLAGLELTAGEASVLRQARPCGVILFTRNVSDPAQVRRLTDDARAAIGADISRADRSGGRPRAPAAAAALARASCRPPPMARSMRKTARGHCGPRASSPG